MSTNIISYTPEELLALPRSAGKAEHSGSDYYFTGKPCKRGHTGARYTNSYTCVKCAHEHDRRWRAENTDRVRESSRAYRAANQGKERERRRTWSATNPEKDRAYERNRRARKRNAPGAHTAADIFDLLNQTGGHCAYCGTECADDYHVDHMIPLSRGGSNGPENLCIACPSCNLRKNAKTAEEFIAFA